MPRPLEVSVVGAGVGFGAGGGGTLSSLDDAGGGDGFGGETSRVVWAGAFDVVVDGFAVVVDAFAVVVDAFDVVVDGFGGETSRVVWAGAFDVVVDVVLLLLDVVLLLLDVVLLPLCPPDLATGLGGIRQTLGEDQTDQGIGPEEEAHIAGAAAKRWA